jgi:uncharacterized protein (TIGR02145 family)
MQAKDGNGNNLSAGGLVVTMSTTGSAIILSNDKLMTDVGDGTYTATITSTTAETVTVTAAFGGANVPNTAAVSFTATVGNSTLTASPDTVPADGGTSSTITMQAKDGNGNNLSAGGLVVTMSTTGSAIILSNDKLMTDEGDGTYTATITSTTVETVTVSATFGGANVTNTADVSFTLPFATVVIGMQTWSASNVSIVPTENNTLGDDYWDDYSGSDGTAADEDGYYYTWDAAMNVCPSGWRLPSDNDWKVLERFLGMYKSHSNDLGARGNISLKLRKNGSSGFNAKMAGINNASYRGSFTIFWTSTSTTEGNGPFYRYLTTYDNLSVYRGNDQFKDWAMSVRCLMD